MADVTFAAAFLFWAVAPGLILAKALRLSWSGAELAAGSVGLSMAVVSFAAYATSAVGLPVTPTVTFLAIAVGGAVLASRARRRASVGRPADGRTAAPDVPLPPWLPWLVLLLPIVVVRQLEPMWSAGLLIPPTMYDGLDHAMWFRLILDTHSVMPAEVSAPPLNPDGSADFYPWGLHAWLALVAGSTTLEPMTAFFRSLVGVSAAVPLSIYVFAARFTGRGWPALAAAALSLVFWWLPYQAWGWGGYALLAGAVAALPVSRLALDVARDGRPAPLAAAGAVGVGLLLVHPSQAMAALLICATVSLTLAIGRVEGWRGAVPFVLALAAAAFALAFAGSAWAPLESFLARAQRIGANLVSDGSFDWPAGAYARAVWYLPAAGSIALFALYAIGAIVALREARLRPILAVHVVFSLMIPLADSRSWFTSFWYHAPERIWYLQYACLPILAALGVLGLMQSADWLMRGRARLVGRQAIVWPLVLLVFLGGVRSDFSERATNFLRFFAHRSRPPIPADPALRADFRWIEANVPAGETIFNSSADWGLSLPFTGHRTVFWSGGYAIDPSTNWHGLQDRLGRGDPATSFAARELPPMGIRYVYAASVDPRLAINGRTPLPAGTLASAQALEQVYASPTGAVFRVREETGLDLGLADSERIRFEGGFWGAESGGGRTWRWTNGLGRFTILPAAEPAAGCAVRLLGPDPDEYRVLANGEELPVSPRGHELPAGLGGDEPVEIAIVSSASRPADTDPSGDDRLLGVRVYGIGLDCGLGSGVP